MTNEEKFLSEGAAYFGNRLIYRNKDVGITAPNASLVLTIEGEEELARLNGITDVVVKTPKVAKKAANAVDVTNIDDILS